MPASADFRRGPYSERRVRTAGAHLGRTSYARLYAAENLLRIIIHSILDAQIGSGWWNKAVSRPILNDVEGIKRPYSLNPGMTPAGPHDIYYTQLKHLGEIIRSNRVHFDPLIPNLDDLLVEIEHIRAPRNLVSHMNYPARKDEQRVDRFFRACIALADSLQSSPRLRLQIP